LANLFLLPSKKFLPISFKIQLLETSPHKQKEHRQKQLADVFSLSVHFEFFASSLTVYILPICLPIKETAEIETGLAEKSSWDQANIWQKLGLVWIKIKKISQIIKDYFY
jgi:hypothetical protein